ncbi:ABC transporter ATP-binding protein [Mesorhizobium sp. Cs1299R1N3]|uniref:ABC transporter ATP-binding protein n=1 Tax=Mesorhizobium sp. Cs1299R1N3 TaxID=3015173 RepID=UPI00301B92BF
MNDVKISAEHVRKYYAETSAHPIRAIEDVNLDVKEGEFVSLLGPSGCGKSTFLFMVGGFERPTSGMCFIDGKPIQGPGADRGIVFQEYALFPWQKVRHNISYGMRIAGKSKVEQDRRVAELIQMTGLQGFEDRYPEHLSGGMKQRVAIARALAYDPQILLMDEPFGALDAQTRSKMISDLISIHQKTRKTTLFVTHNVEEAILLSDKVALFSARPSRIKTVFPIEMPHPRKVTDDGFVKYERQILDSLEEEMWKTEQMDANAAHQQ